MRTHYQAADGRLQLAAGKGAEALRRPRVRRLLSERGVKLCAAAVILAACSHPPGPVAAGPDAPAPPAVDAAATTDAGTDPAIALWHGRADVALEKLLIAYWTQGSSYLAAASPSDGTLTGYWTFAQALDAVLDGVERSGGARFAGWVATLYAAQDARGWSRDYYDDENWMTLALIRAYDLEGDAAYLAEARTLYADIRAAWDTTCCGATPGGIWWDRSHTQKATASNAGPVIAGVRLAKRTGDPSYLAFATQVYAYWHQTMVDPTTHAVIDHIDPTGKLTRYKFTYNEGLMIGAAVELYGATGDASYLADAHAIASYLLASETESTADGTVLSDGSNASCSGDCQQFKGIALRYVAELYAADPSHAELAQLVASSAHAIWDDARGGDGLFATDWAGPSATAATIDADSSATMALARYAELLGADPLPPDPGYQAEDGVVHAIGLEATHQGFAGWAYLAGWNADGQWVDFHVNVAAAGTYTLTLRYSAGAGDASRLVYIDGANAVPDLALPATASWDVWASQTARVELPAGASTISIIYNSSLGSTNYVNLDAISLGP